MNLSSHRAKSPRRRSKGGFTLLETILAVTMFAMMIMALLTLLSFTQRTRVQVEARHEGAIKAHSRAVLFVRGELYSEVFAAGNGSTVVKELSPEPLPGGFPFRSAKETLQVSADGHSATLTIEYEIETAREKPATCTASIVRYR